MEGLYCFRQIYLKYTYNSFKNDNNKLHNPNWQKIPDHPCRISIIDGSGSGKTEALLNFINYKKLFENEDI